MRFDPGATRLCVDPIWVTDATPVHLKNLRETAFAAYLEPRPAARVPRREFSADDTVIGRVGAKEVQDYFDAMGSPGASTYSRDAAHPYMRKPHARLLPGAWRARLRSC